MTDVALRLGNQSLSSLKWAWDKKRVWLAIAALIALTALLAPAQLGPSLAFTANNLVAISPFLILSIGTAAYAAATGADGLIARAFTGSPVAIIILASLAGALSPFCSCGVIPLIAALLAMGVPLSAVMAFWLASPLMDPSMFLLTVATLGTPFAIAKTVVAIALGLVGGFVVYAMQSAGYLQNPLRPDIGDGGCGGATVRSRKDVVWAFRHQPERTKKFRKNAISTTEFLVKWLTLAFFLESLMLAYIPAELVASTLGGGGIAPIVWATLTGVPAYLNGYAALPLVGGLVGQGMQPGAGMAFLIAGGVTSIPAAIAVFALVKKPVFALYIALSLAGALTAGLAWQMIAG